MVQWMIRKYSGIAFTMHLSFCSMVSRMLYQQIKINISTSLVSHMILLPIGSFTQKKKTISNNVLFSSDYNVVCAILHGIYFSFTITITSTLGLFTIHWLIRKKSHVKSNYDDNFICEGLTREIFMSKRENWNILSISMTKKDKVGQIEYGKIIHFRNWDWAQ